MKKILTVLVFHFIIISQFTVMAQESKLWDSLDYYQNNGKPRSALKIADILHDKAVKSGVQTDIYKCLFTKMKFVNAVGEKDFHALIRDFEAEAEIAKVPLRQMLYSAIAEMYWWYYSDNQWTILQRTATVEFDNDDIETWSAEALIAESIKWFDLSLTDAELLEEAYQSDYKDIINGYYSDEGVTLYEFLAWRAFEFYRDHTLSIEKPKDQFLLNDNKLFGSNDEFLQASKSVSDTLSFHFNAIRILQQLTEFSQKQNNDELSSKTEINRLVFVWENFVGADKDVLYEAGLKRCIDTYKTKNASARANYYLADLLYTQGQGYSENYPSLKGRYKQANEMCNHVMEKYPDTWGASNCENLAKSIKKVELSVKAEQTVGPEQTFAVNVSYRNVESLHYSLGRISVDKIQNLRDKYYNSSEEASAIYKQAQTVKKGTIKLPVQSDFRKHSLDFLIEGLPLGHYVLFVDNDELMEGTGFKYIEIHVSDILQVQKSNYGNSEVYFYSRTTDKVLPGVKVTYSTWSNSKRKYVNKTKVSDEDGKVVFERKDDGYANIVEICKDGDCSFNARSNIYRAYHDSNNDYDKVQIFTDRAIYRPGQTVYFKCIKWSGSGNNAQTLGGHSVSVNVYDANRQEIFDERFTTNKYGSVSGSFVIPQGQLNGVFTIEVSAHFNVRKIFRVEDYKRPQFEVTFDDFAGDYRLGDTIKLKGKAQSFAGAALSNADAVFKIDRLGIGRYWFTPPQTQLIEQGSLKLAEDGTFDVEFVAMPDPLTKENANRRFSFTISVDVTDINGETQGSQTKITVGDRSLWADIAMPDEIVPDDIVECQLTVMNMNDKPAKAKGNLRVYKLITPQKTLRERLWPTPDTALYSAAEWAEKFPANVYYDENKQYETGKLVADYRFDTEVKRSVVLSGVHKWDAGVYKLVLETTDAFGKPVEVSKQINVLDPKQKKMHKAEIVWFGDLKAVYEPGESVELPIGSSAEIWLRMEVEKNGKIVRNEKISLSDEIKIIRIPVEETDRGNFFIRLIAVENNRVYQKDYTVYVPYSDKLLNVSFETFRNKLHPGEEEQWRLRISGPGNEKVAAEMLACLYDQSLDKFVKHNWAFSPHRFKTTHVYWRHNYSFTYEHTNQYYYSYYRRAFPNYANLEWFGFSYNNRSLNRRAYYGYANGEALEISEYEEEEVLDEMMDMAAPAPMAKPQKAKRMKNEVSASIVTEQDDEIVADDVVAEEGAETEIPLRSNFNETAFFMPQLETDEKGDILVNFTMPDALTRWKMFGVAHTTDLKYGVVENELVTQKELMVQPNLPRFLREGDKIRISAKISNLITEDLSGKASIECFDALTMKPLSKMIVSDAKQPFTVKTMQSTAVEWDLQVPETVQAVVFRIKATTGKFTDGEERSLPVLSNRMLVTESMPLPMSHKGKKTFVFEHLKNNNSKTLRHHQFTLEYCSNPAWYAILALPYLIEFPYECAEQTFSRYYANSIAEHIVNSNPKIRSVFDTWKKEESKETFVSNLEKNQELKNILLEETPWLRDAQNETERKKRTAALFDIHQMAANKLSAINRLSELQLSNGAWPWFSKGRPSQYITQHIVCGLGKMEKMGVPVDGVLKQKQDRSLNYLCGEIKKEYEWMKHNVKEKEWKKQRPSYSQVHFLYMLSFYPDYTPQKRNKEAVDFYIKQSEKYWLEYNIYLQSMISVSASRRGNKELEKNITESLAERALRSEEMGMYYKQEYGWYWYQMPIETQAMIIEAFAEKGDTGSVNELKVWLLKQKQTQDWKTTKATTEAVYALLMEGANWLDSEEMVSIELGGDNVTDEIYADKENFEAGSGYFKTKWDGSNVDKQMATITVTNPNEHPAWGAAYWQYFEQLDKIEGNKTPLQLDKKLFLEKQTDNGTVISPIVKNTAVAIGDVVVVRIELRVDRDMEFVHMKDMRASGLEPMSVLSQYKWQDGLWYYESTRDAATNFFFDYLQKGTYVFEYKLRASQAGDFSNGITTIQSMYAPEFSSHSEGVRVEIK